MQDLCDESCDVGNLPLRRPGRSKAAEMHADATGRHLARHLFRALLPLTRRLSGRTDLHAEQMAAKLGRALPENDKREEYMRATLETKNGELIATPFPNQDSSLIAPLAKAECLIIRERFAPSAEAGAPCVIVKLGL